MRQFTQCACAAVFALLVAYTWYCPDAGKPNESALHQGLILFPFPWLPFGVFRAAMAARTAGADRLVRRTIQPATQRRDTDLLPDPCDVDFAPTVIHAQPPGFTPFHII